MSATDVISTQAPRGEAQGFVARFAAIARRQSVIDAAARLLRVVTIVLAALLTIILIDAWMPMSAWLRGAMAVMLLLFIAWSCRPDEGWIARRWPRLARSIEDRAGIANNRVTNAVCLADLPAHNPSPLAATLAQRSLLRGEEALSRADRSRLVSKARMRSRLFWLLAALAVWAAMIATIPRLPLGGLARVAMPWADHPPFSWTLFSVNISPVDEVPYGGDATVRVELSGKLPTGAELVELDENGQPARRLPMRQVTRNDKRVVLERKLTGLSKATTFHIEASTGRSRRSHITVGAPPATVPRPASDVAKDDGSSASPQRAAAAQANALSQMADRIRQRAAELKSRLQGLPPGEPVPDWLRHQLDALKQDLERFTGRTQSLEDLLKNLMESKESTLSEDAQLMRAIGDMIDKLRQLNLPEFKGTPISANLAATKQAGELEDAAAKDADSLRGGLAQLDDALGGVTKQGGSLAPTVLESPDPRGTFNAAGHSGTQVDTSDARLRHVPAQYRELVARYFQRVAKDAK